LHFLQNLTLQDQQNLPYYFRLKNVILHFLQNITLQAVQNLTLQNQHKIPATWIVRRPMMLTAAGLKCSLLPPALG
jgi:hypothetical protein